MDSIKADLKSIQQEIDLDSRTKPVKTLWSTLTSKLSDSIQKHIPKKTLFERWNIPCMKNNIR